MFMELNPCIVVEINSAEKVTLMSVDSGKEYKSVQLVKYYPFTLLA